MNSIDDTARNISANVEFKNGWRLIVSSFVGLAIGLTAVPFYTYGVFAAPLQAEFGWSRGAAQLPLLFQTIGALTLLPVVGWATDKYGARPIVLISLVAYFLAFSSFSLMQGNVLQYYATATLLGAAGAGTMPITWTKAINGAFFRNRGIALGLALMGTGLAGFIAPGAANSFIESYGWRTTYLLFAIIPAVVGIPIIYILFRENKQSSEQAGGMKLAGLSFSEALQGYRIWIIALSFLVISFSIGGAIPNMFPLFTDVGLTPGKAASILSLVGLSVIVGRVVTGILMDRFWAPGVAAALMVLPAISSVLLIANPSYLPAAYVATVLIGFAAGAEFDIMAYLASRYFGLLNYSKIYSILYAAFAIGASAAPAVFGTVFDKTGSYDAIFWVTAGLFLIGSFLLLFLGKYPNFDDGNPGNNQSAELQVENAA